MKTIKGWWFAPKNKKLANGDGRKIKVGSTHKIKGEIIPCQRGLHLSPKPLNALQYAPGPIIYRVKGGGIIKAHGAPVDKYACSERTYIAGGIDASAMLWKFARLCALDVIHLWDAPDIVMKYLKTGDEKHRDAARDAAWDAARDAAWIAAGAAARAARDAAWNAAWDAAGAAAWIAAGAAARDAAWIAGDAAREKQNKRLSRMLNRLIKCQT